MITRIGVQTFKSTLPVAKFLKFGKSPHSSRSVFSVQIQKQSYYERNASNLGLVTCLAEHVYLFGSELAIGRDYHTIVKPRSS